MHGDFEYTEEHEFISTVNQSNLVSYSQLCDAFMDLMSYMDHDWKVIKRKTGLSEERCKNITKIYYELL